MGSNPGTVYWMDIFSHIIVVKIVMMFNWKWPKINEKEAGVGPFKNNNTEHWVEPKSAYNISALVADVYTILK